MTRPRNARALLVGVLAASVGPAGCTCGSRDEPAGSGPSQSMLAFEPGPEITQSPGLPDPLWARELGRLPQSAQHVVLVNADELRAAIASGALRERVSEALQPLGGPLALPLVEALLEEIDGSRPIAVGAFALPNERELADARYGAVIDADAIPAFIHTRVIVPSRDAPGLLAALATASEGAGLEPHELDPDLASRLPPATRSFALSGQAGSPELVVLAIPDHRELRLEIAWGNYTNRFHYEAALLRVGAPPRERTVERTPAIDHLLIERPLLGILERPEGAARLTLTTALIEAARAVEESGSSVRTATWARGLAIALVGFATLDPRDRIQAETALGVDLDRDLNVHSIVTLTPLGASVADSALVSDGYVYDAEPGACALVLQSGESMRASTGAAPAATWTRSLSDDELRGRWGWASGLATESGVRHSRWPTLQTLSRVLESEQLDVAGMLPDAMTLAVGHGDPAPIAIALDYGPHVDVAAAQSTLERMPWPAELPSLSVHEIAGRKLLLVGIGGAPEQLLDVATPRRTGHVERVEIDRRAGDTTALLPAAWAGWFEMLGPAWAGWTDAVHRASYVQAHRGASVLGQASIALELGRTPRTPRLTAHGDNAPAPLAVIEDAQGWHCLRDIPVLAIDALDALSAQHSTPPARLAASLGFEDPDWAALGELARGDDEASRARLARAAQALDTIWSTLDPLLACAEQDPASEPTAHRVRGRWLVALAGWADALPDVERARAWARQGCTLGAERACEQLEIIQARGSVALAVRPWLSYPLLGTPSLELVLGPRSMRLEGRSVSDVDDLARSLRHRLSDRPLLGHEVAVHVDAAVSYQRLRAVTDSLLTHGLVPQLVVRDPAGRLMALEVADAAEAAARESEARVEALAWSSMSFRRERGMMPVLSKVPADTTWARVSERLLELGTLPEAASPAEAARHRAVGSASAIPPVAFGR